MLDDRNGRFESLKKIKNEVEDLYTSNVTFRKFQFYETSYKKTFSDNVTLE